MDPQQQLMLKTVIYAKETRVLIMMNGEEALAWRRLQELFKVLIYLLLTITEWD